MNLSPRHADLILKFLSHTNIVGGDAPVFMECIVLLQAIAQQTSDATPSIRDDITIDPTLSRTAAGMSEARSE